MGSEAENHSLGNLCREGKEGRREIVPSRRAAALIAVLMAGGQGWGSLAGGGRQRRVRELTNCLGAEVGASCPGCRGDGCPGGWGRAGSIPCARTSRGVLGPDAVFQQPEACDPVFPLEQEGSLDVLLFWGSLAASRGLSVCGVQGGGKTRA